MFVSFCCLDFAVFVLGLFGLVDLVVKLFGLLVVLCGYG